MSGLILKTNSVSKPANKSVSTTAFNNLIKSSVPRIKGTNFEVGLFAGHKFSVVFDGETTNQVALNGEPVNATIISGQGAFLNKTEIQAVTAPMQVRLKDVMLAGAEVQLTRKDADSHSLILEELDGTAVMDLDAKTGVIAGFGAGTLDFDTVGGGDHLAEESEISILIEEDAIVVKKDGQTLQSSPITWSGEVQNGTSVFTSSGTGASSSLPFSQTDTLQLEDTVTNVEVSFSNNFDGGERQTYNFKLGEVMTPNAGLTEKVLNLNAGANANIDITGDVVGGVGAKTYKHKSGQIPQGLSVQNGIIVGQTNQDGNYIFELEVTDEYGQSVIIEYSLAVAPVGNISYDAPNAVVGKYYKFVPPIVEDLDEWSVAGNIPDGLTFDTADGSLKGTPTDANVFDFSPTATNTSGNPPESVNVSLTVYSPMSASFDEDGQNNALANAGSLERKVSTRMRIKMADGSGKYNYHINNGNIVDQNGNITFLRAGDTVLTVTDVETRETFSLNIGVYGQDSVLSYNVINEADEENVYQQNPDIVSQCGASVNVAFDAWQIITDFGKAPKMPPVFSDAVNGETFKSGKPFAMFKTNAENGIVEVSNVRGKDFVSNLVVSRTMITATKDIGMGLGYELNLDTPLRYELVITELNGDKVVELRKEGVYIADTRHTIEEGQTVGFGKVNGSFLLYVDDNLEESVTMDTDCSGLELMVYAKASGVIFGGRIENLTYEIETGGSPSEVGTIDVQTGEYISSADNTSIVTIKATPTANPNVSYRSTIRLIKPSPKSSFEDAMRLSYVELQVWIAAV